MSLPNNSLYFAFKFPTLFLFNHQKLQLNLHLCFPLLYSKIFLIFNLDLSIPLGPSSRHHSAAWSVHHTVERYTPSTAKTLEKTHTQSLVSHRKSSRRNRFSVVTTEVVPFFHVHIPLYCKCLYMHATEWREYFYLYFHPSTAPSLPICPYISVPLSVSHTLPPFQVFNDCVWSLCLHWYH